jgi:hypothetical protein
MRRLALVVVAACAHRAAPPPPPANIHVPAPAAPSDNPIPEEVRGVRLAMSQTELLAARPNVRLEKDAPFSFRTEAVEQVHDGTLVDVTYYLSKQGRVYEVIVEYADPATAHAAFARLEKLGAPAPEGDDLVIRGFPYPVHAWAFDAKVVVAAAFDDDEWVETWK